MLYLHATTNIHAFLHTSIDNKGVIGIPSSI